jgi:two-component system, LytTR family, response regulator
MTRSLETVLSRPHFLEEAPAAAPARKIGLPVREGFVFLYPHEITWCQANGAYSTIYYGAGKKLLLSKNLTELEPLLHASMFFRVHHSAIINLGKVTRYFRGKGGEVEMEDGSIVSVSAQKKKLLLERYTLPV